MKYGEKVQEFIKHSGRDFSIKGSVFFILFIFSIFFVASLLINIVAEPETEVINEAIKIMYDIEKSNIEDISIIEEEIQNIHKRDEIDTISYMGKKEGIEWQNLNVEEIEDKAQVLNVVEEIVIDEEKKTNVMDIAEEAEIVNITSVENNFIYMDKTNIKSHSNLTIEEIKELTAPYEKLWGVEEAIYNLDKENNINAFFTLAVLRLESGNGEYTSGKNNYFNTTTLSGEWVDYESRGESIEAFGELIEHQYFAEDGLWYEPNMKDGVSLKEMEKHYCPFEELDPKYNSVEWIEYNEQFRWSYRVGNIMDQMYYQITN